MMEKGTSSRQQKQEQALEESYRRGYHHGLARMRELLLRLLIFSMRGYLLAWLWNSVASSRNISSCLGAWIPAPVPPHRSLIWRNASACSEQKKIVRARGRHEPNAM